MPLRLSAVKLPPGVMHTPLCLWPSFQTWGLVPEASQRLFSIPSLDYSRLGQMSKITLKRMATIYEVLTMYVPSTLSLILTMIL